MHSISKWILFFLLLPLFARAHVDAIFSEDEDLTLYHHVNVITGNLNLHFQDMLVQGAVPLPLIRTYTSAGALERDGSDNDLQLKQLRNHWLIQGGWNLLPHANLFVENAEDERDIKLFLAEKNGSVIAYVFERYEKDGYLFRPDIKGGQCSGILSARTNPRNNRILFRRNTRTATLFLPDGGTRTYVHLDSVWFDKDPLYYLALKEEIAPHRQCTTYDYNEYFHLKQVAVKDLHKLKTFSSIQFQAIKTGERGGHFHFHATTSDGKEMHYRSLLFKGRNYLHDVQSNFRPHESINFIPGRKGIGARMHSLTLGDKLEFQVQYYEPADRKQARKWLGNPHKKEISVDKVKVLEGPMGPRGEFIPIASFSYLPTYTDVRDVEQILTRYHHDNNRLLAIEYFNREGQLNSKLDFLWEGEHLKAKIFLQNPTTPFFSKTFQYDSAGNVTEETLWGNLTGNALGSFAVESNGTLRGAESYRKRYTYLPVFNVPLSEEEEEGPTYRYHYWSGTNLLKAQFTCDQDRILIRQFYCYNEDHLLAKEIIDDGCSENADDLSGVTERHIKNYALDPNTGLVLSCTELYWEPSTGEEKLLKRTEFSYSPQKRVIAEAVYDANSTYRYTLHSDYDAQGRIILKTTPLGQKNTYRFDQQGNLLESKEVGAPQKVYSYHPSGNPLSCQEILSDGEVRTTNTLYDAKGRLIAQTDARGNTTTQVYDEFGRCLETRFPRTPSDQPSARFSYDALGNLASTTSPRSDTTHTIYNTLKKLICVTYPDGTTVKHTYNKNGTLAKTLYPDRTEARYSYDILQRMTSKQIYSANGELVTEERWEYSAFHLVSQTDVRGLTTYFQYDGAGRKVAEISEERAQFFSYDALGFLEKTSDGNAVRIEIHDEGGRVALQWTEDALSRIENRMQFFYDEENRKVKAIRFTSLGPATDLFSYDSQGRLCKHENPLGEISQWIYSETTRNDLNQLILQKTSIDPLGHQKIETFDALDHLVALERKDANNNTVALEEYAYDGSGNRTHRITSVFRENVFVKKIETHWHYDCRDRLIKQIESGQKTTSYAYDERGRLLAKTLPSGITLFHTYDSVDRLTSLLSSDGTIHHQLHYEQGPDPTLLIDKVTGIQLTRRYNLFGQLLEESHSTGLHYNWDYDKYGRYMHFVLPDGSQINYSYLGVHLASVQRRSSDGAILYQHNYKAFDPNGHVQIEELIHNLGEIHTQRDLLERPSTQTSPWIQHSVSYGPSGLVSSAHNSLFGSKEYAYDALDQLIRESDATYSFDSLGNPTHSHVDDCNQLLATPTASFTYDLDGNPLVKDTPDGKLSYTYDALGRLTSISQNDTTTLYQYDPLSRLVSREIRRENSTEKIFYLYDRETEIGALNADMRIQQLKILGLGLKADIGATIAIELNSEVFAPLHDFNGNIIALLSSDGQIAERYEIDAFGKEKCQTPPTNPWRFCSKRTEGELIFFGKRFYSPFVARWLTPDPAGFADGPNLYLFVLNTPLNRLDLFGLYSTQIFPWSNNQIEINIEVPLSKITDNSKGIIVVKGNIGDVKVDWVVSCGHLHKLQTTPEELSAGKVNIFNHFHELMPKEGMIVGLITGQNGMRVSLSEFVYQSKSTTEKFPESALYIGLYNAKSSFIGDIVRVFKERRGHDTPIVCITRQFMEAIVDTLHNINPNLLWMHVSHSEAGLIAYNAIDKMTPDHKQKLQEHLISFSLGPARPIPESFAFKAINIYSHKDYITKRFSKPFRKDPNYDIRFVECLSPISERSLFFADHAFLGMTYLEALKKQFDDSREKIGFYDNQVR